MTTQDTLGQYYTADDVRRILALSVFCSKDKMLPSCHYIFWSDRHGAWIGTDGHRLGAYRMDVVRDQNLYEERSKERIEAMAIHYEDAVQALKWRWTEVSFRWINGSCDYTRQLVIGFINKKNDLVGEIKAHNLWKYENAANVSKKIEASDYYQIDTSSYECVAAPVGFNVEYMIDVVNYGKKAKLPKPMRAVYRGHLKPSKGVTRTIDPSLWTLDTVCPEFSCIIMPIRIS